MSLTFNRTQNITLQQARALLAGHSKAEVVAAADAAGFNLDPAAVQAASVGTIAAAQAELSALAGKYTPADAARRKQLENALKVLWQLQQADAPQAPKPAPKPMATPIEEQILAAEQKRHNAAMANSDKEVSFWSREADRLRRQRSACAEREFNHEED